MERKEIIFNSPLCFDFGQSQTLGDNTNMDIVDIKELHYKMMVMLGPHIINSHLKPNVNVVGVQSLHHDVMVMSGLYVINSQNQELHHKVMIMLGSHFVNNHSKQDDALLKDTLSMAYDYEFPTHESN